MKTYIKMYVLCHMFYIVRGGKYDQRLVRNLHDLVDTDDLSPNCKTALTMYSARLNNTTIEDEDIWALQMLDATSKIAVGLLSYNFGELGNFKQCIEIESKKDNIMGKYCLGSILVNSSAIDNDSVYVKNHIFLTSLISRVAGGIQMVGNPTWAICLPSNCSDNDAIRLMNMTDELGLSIDSVTCQTLNDVDPRLNTDAIIGIFILSILLLLITVSTSIDIYCLYKQKVSVRPIYVSFSLYTNGQRLFTIPQRKSNLCCLDGIKVISMLWIVILHTYSVYTSGPIFNSKDVVDFANSLASMIFINGDLACDTFLLVGGILVTYTFFRAGKGGQLTIASIIEHYVHRYIRLTPALAGVVLVSATLLRYMGSGPKWNFIVDAFQGFCKEYWWTALLYIQNHVNVSNMCAGHSWYLDVDMQLYLFSPAIFWLLKKHSIAGLTTLTFATLASIVTCFVKAYLNEMSGITSTYYPKTPSTIYMNSYYLKTETRAAPWLMGTILGYILTRKKYTSFKPLKRYVVTLWILSLAVIMLCVLGGHSTLRGPQYLRLENAFYIALVRPSFSLAVGWVIWACATNHGGIVNIFLSLPIFQFMNKFIYSMYLLHVTSLYMIIFSSKTSIYFSVFNLAYWFWGIFMFMFGLSILWVLVFESPMIALEKIIFKKDQ